MAQEHTPYLQALMLRRTVAETLAQVGQAAPRKNGTRPTATIAPPPRAVRIIAIVAAPRPSPVPASVGTGRDTYTMRTVREYLRRVRAQIQFHAQALERLARLSKRYERRLHH